MLYVSILSICIVNSFISDYGFKARILMVVIVPFLGNCLSFKPVSHQPYDCFVVQFCRG